MRWILEFPMVGLLWAVLIQSAIAGPLEDGIAALEQHEYATAFRLLEPLAKQGNAEAQYNLGLWYENGRGEVMTSAQAASDDAEAMNWYQKAAIQGHLRAQQRLDQMRDSIRLTAGNHTEFLVSPERWTIVVGVLSLIALLSFALKRLLAESMSNIDNARRNRSLGRRSDHEVTFADGIRPERNCRWIEDKFQPNSTMVRWICPNCSEFGYTVDHRPPKECKRSIRSPTL
jgi:hypothetical protein